MKRIILLVLILYSIGSTACKNSEEKELNPSGEKPEWKYLGLKLDNGIQLYIKSEPIVSNSYSAKYWVKVIYPEKTVKGVTYYKPEVMMVYEVRCESGEVRKTGQFIAIDEGGNTIATGKEGHEDFTYPVPNSLDEKVLKDCCDK
ncbi:MAG: hypothetical protein IPJ31_08885 [Bacteroidetes bacterium]|nr:hypothetical protein [Bacteroidota bacterium]